MEIHLHIRNRAAGFGCATGEWIVTLEYSSIPKQNLLGGRQRTKDGMAAAQVVGFIEEEAHSIF